MKKSTILVAVLAFAACKQSPEKPTNEEPQTHEVTMAASTYPEALSKVFDAHGGLQLWKRQRTMSFVLPKPALPETHTVDLWTRMDRVDTEQYSMGFDGAEAWLLDPQASYKGDVGFYHNLMFYFYAMPFVLADDGILYSEAEHLEFEGKSYPGYKIAYQNGVGASSKDEYYIHYDPDTFQMAWLGYTVTYRSGESSDNIRWINYKDWQQLNGVWLPKSITWHNYEGRAILEPKSTVAFEQATLSLEPRPKSFYEEPEGAHAVPIKVIN